MHIRPASSADASAVWSIIEPMIRAGETYALDRNLSRAEAIAYWMGADKEVFVAEEAGAILGTYYIRPNQAGGGRHVCNCGYVTAADATGRASHALFANIQWEPPAPTAIGQCSSTSW